MYFHWQAGFTGWTIFGTTAALLAVGLVAFRTFELELGIAFALIVATQGFVLTLSTTAGYGARLPAKLGFVFAALFYAAVLFRSRSLRPPRDRVALRALAASAGAAFVAASLIPTWGFLPDGWVSRLLFVPRSWLGIASILLAIRLVGAWLRPKIDADWVVVVPLVLLAHVALELIHRRVYHLNAGAWIVIALSLLLALLGWLEYRGRLERFTIPEILRVDRL